MLTDVQTQIDNLERRVATLEQRLLKSSRQARMASACVVLTAVLGLVLLASPEASAQFGLTLSSLNARLTAVEIKTAPISRNGNDMVIQGVNVHILDGSGSTLSTSGVGNLVIGYNEVLYAQTVHRTGSHNLVVGSGHSYPAYGGIVAGYQNTINGNYATVTGGAGNTANNSFSSVSGGLYRTVNVDEGWVAGTLSSK